MDVESKETIAASLAQLDASLQLRLTQLDTIIANRVNDALGQVSNITKAALEGVQASVDSGAAKLQGIVDSLDGYTVELDPPIVIKAFKLNKAKEIA